MRTITKVLLTALAVIILAEILPGTEITGLFTAVWVAISIGLLNLTVRPLLVFFTLPATILTFGLFIFVINACVILLADYFVDGFYVNGFWYALLFSVCLSAFRSFLFKFVKDDSKKPYKTTINR